MADLNALTVRIEHKGFPGSTQPVLKDLALDAQAGEFVGLVGPSGAGKSTLLNIISGLDTAVTGSVRLNGRELIGTHPGDDAQLGYVFQEPRLLPWLSVLDNLLLVLPKGELTRAMAMLEAVNLEGFAGRYPGQLSGGQQRRCALARAFVVKPALLLLDEPFVSLDAPTADHLRCLLIDLWSETRPIIVFVTHNLREALALTDRVIFLSSGPASVVLELPVTLPRPRTVEDPGVSRLRDSVLAAHPELLSGDGTQSTPANRWKTA